MLMDGKPKFAKLSPDQEQTLQDLEKDLGEVYVIAYEQPPAPARLADDALEMLQDAERKMPGVVLVAYRKQKVAA